MTETEATIFKATIPGAAVISGLDYCLEAVDKAGRQATYPPGAGVTRIAVTVTTDATPPTVEAFPGGNRHAAVTEHDLGKPLTVRARVSDDSGVKWVRLRYRGVNQHQDFRTLPMLPTGRKHEYQAVIPATHIRPEWDLMYYLEVMDIHGIGAIHPNLEKETPYVVVKLRRPEEK